MNQFYYVYALRSHKDGDFYVGASRDLRIRIQQHEAGEVRSTVYRRPLELIYYEACRSRDDAFKREKYLKSAWGKRYLKTRLAGYLTG